MTENTTALATPQQAGIWVQKFDSWDSKYTNTSPDYVVGYNDADDNLIEVRLRFQRGAVTEVGINGITNEILLAILVDSLEDLQTGTGACDENALALRCLKQGFSVLTQQFSQVTHEALTALEDQAPIESEPSTGLQRDPP